MSAGAKPGLQDVREPMTQFVGASPQKLEAKFFQIPIEAVQPSPTNPRKRFEKDLAELAASIETQGVLEPLLVRPQTGVDEHALDSGRERYEIVFGERRWRAAKLAKQTHVPCLVRMMDDEAVLDAQISENLQRADISPLEQAASFQLRLKAAGDAGHKMSVDDLAKQIGKGSRWVYDRLELLKLSAGAKEALEERFIQPGHASELVRLKPELQAAALEATLKKELSVMQLRCWLVDAKHGCGMAGRALRASAKAAAEACANPHCRHSRGDHFEDADCQRCRCSRWRRPAISREKPERSSNAEIQRGLEKCLAGVLVRARPRAQFRIARIAPARKRGEWLAVLVQTSAKSRRAAR